MCRSEFCFLVSVWFDSPAIEKGNPVPAQKILSTLEQNRSGGLPAVAQIHDFFRFFLEPLLLNLTEFSNLKHPRQRSR